MTILYLLQSVFTIWMLVDAVKRRPIIYWYVIIFLPFGPFVYFFAFKIHDREFDWLRNLFRVAPRGPSLTDLRERAKESPSVENRMRLGNALHDAGHYAEAAEVFEGILGTHADEADALYGLGRCKMELGEPQAAVELLTRLVERNRAYRDYTACLELAEALTRTGDDDEAIELLQGLLRASPRPRHAVALARRLVVVGRIEEAQQILRESLADHERSHAANQRRDRQDAGEAAELLKSISPKD